MVDDDPDICLTLMEIFKQNGFIADSFTDPLLALDNFKAGLYDLLLLDIKMPEMNGFQLHQEMKKIDNTVKFCFLTAGEENTFYGYHKKVFSSPASENRTSRYYLSFSFLGVIENHSFRAF